MAEETIEQVCNGLRKYYGLMKKEYDSNFSEFCEANGLDDIDEEIDAGADETMLLEFDEDFPFPKGTSDDASEEEKNAIIFDIIKRCYESEDPNFADLVSGTIDCMLKHSVYSQVIITFTS